MCQGFLTAQRTGRVGEYSVVQSLNVEGDSGVSTSTVARHLSVISGSSRSYRSAGTW
jgi:hypothetical protein